MNRHIARVVVFACTFLGSGAWAGPIVYDVSLSGQTSVLTGSITTNGQLGTVVAADITAWSFTAVGLPSFSISSSDPGAHITCAATCGLTASLQSLTNAFDAASYIEFFSVVEAEGVKTLLDAGDYFPAWFVSIPHVGGPFDHAATVGSGAVFAAIPPTPIAEPANLSLFAIAIAGVLAISRKPAVNRRVAALPQT
jgi:hypothetical protein